MQPVTEILCPGTEFKFGLPNGTNCHMTTACVWHGQLGLSPSQKSGMTTLLRTSKGMQGEQGANVKCVLLIFASKRKICLLLKS